MNVNETKQKTRFDHEYRRDVNRQSYLRRKARLEGTFIPKTIMATKKEVDGKIVYIYDKEHLKKIRKERRLTKEKETKEIMFKQILAHVYTIMNATPSL